MYLDLFNLILRIIRSWVIISIIAICLIIGLRAGLVKKIF